MMASRIRSSSAPSFPVKIIIVLVIIIVGPEIKVYRVRPPPASRLVLFVAVTVTVIFILGKIRLQLLQARTAPTGNSRRMGWIRAV
jgi:hypothetical protein